MKEANKQTRARCCVTACGSVALISLIDYEKLKKKKQKQKQNKNKNKNKTVIIIIKKTNHIHGIARANTTRSQSRNFAHETRGAAR